MRVRLCFFVNVRKASGRNVAGGRSIGSTVDFPTGFSAGGARMGAVRRGLMGWTGVPNAGDEEGIGFAGTAEGLSGRRVVAMSSCEVFRLTRPNVSPCPFRGLIDVERARPRDASR